MANNPQNLTVAGESPASALNGQELCRIVQSGVSVRTTTQAIALLAGMASTGMARIVTSPGTVAVLPSDTYLVLNFATPQGSTTVNLTTVAAKGGVQVIIVDWPGNAGTVSIVPATGEAIMGMAANTPWTLLSGSGAGSGGWIGFVPISTLGWVVIS